MYYLFIRKKDELEEYRKTFERVLRRIEDGTTPVYNEIRSAKTGLIEAFPANLINGILLVLGTLVLNAFPINELIKIAVVLVVNRLCSAIAEYVFVVAKNALRVRLCLRLGIEPSERNIAVMESLEYQSV